jgi:glycosyltransferase involved in cell wall biosynthesis
VTLTLCGGGSLLGEALEFAARHRNRVRVTGWLPRYAVFSELAASDVLVLPSYAEGSPNSVLEGMAAGLAIACSDIPGCRELVARDVPCGVLFEPGSVQALTDAIVLLSGNPELRSELSANALVLVERDHDLETQVGSVLSATVDRWRDSAPSSRSR